MILESILEGGIRNTNFFNGRVLTAEDLKTEQEANRSHHRMLGQAVGEGVVRGLDISAVAGSSTVLITPGLALNRLGQTLYLPDTVQVKLVPEIEAISGKKTFFSVCKMIPVETSLTGINIYILVISPAEGEEGRAPMSGLFTEQMNTGCGSKYCVEGVQFRLIRLDIGCISGIDDDIQKELKNLMGMTDEASRSRFRNILAHLFLGTSRGADFVRDPLMRINSESPHVTYGVLDTVRSLEEPPLTDHDVPLAMVYWSAGLKFVDIWSVRRRVTEKPASVVWPASERKYAENEALFLQFQEQVEQIFLSSRKMASIEAKNYFRYLPPGGLIPVNEKYLAEYMNRETGVSFTESINAKGFYPDIFFSGLTRRKPAFIAGATVEALINDSFSYPPTDPDSSEMVRCYFVRENCESVITNRDHPPQLHMIFTSGHVPYRGDAGYDLAYWDYSNYSIDGSPKTYE